MNKTMKNIIKIKQIPKIIKRTQYEAENTSKVYQHYLNKGKQQYEQQKGIICFLSQNIVAILIFLSEIQEFNKNNLKQMLIQLQNQVNKFQLILPCVMIFTDSFTFLKVKQIIRLCQLENHQKIKINIIIKKLKPILTQNGQLCLKNPYLSDYLQSSMGNYDFMNFIYEGKTVELFIKNNGFSLLTCIELEYYKGQILDQFFVGYLVQNNQSFHMLYKCTQINELEKKNQNQLVFQSQGQLRLISSINYNKNNQGEKAKKYQWSPTKRFEQNYSLSSHESKVHYIKWQGYFMFELKNHKEIKNLQTDYLDIKEFIKVKGKQVPCWNPVIKQFVENEKVLIFYQPLSNYIKKKNGKFIGLE